jgi:hypothetical protein
VTCWCLCRCGFLRSEELGEEYGLYLEMMAELIDATRELLGSIEVTNHKKGWIAGRLTVRSWLRWDSRLGQEDSELGFGRRRRAKSW